MSLIIVPCYRPSPAPGWAWPAPPTATTAVWWPPPPPRRRASGSQTGTTSSPPQVWCQHNQGRGKHCNCLFQSPGWAPASCGHCVLTAQTLSRPRLGLGGGWTSIPSKSSPSWSLTSSRGDSQLLRALIEAVQFLTWLHSSLTKTRELWCESVSVPLCFTENPIKSQTVNPEKWQLHPAADPPASWEWAATLILATCPGRALAAEAQQFESEKRWCSGEKKTGSWNKSLGNLRLWDQSQSILTNSDKLWKQNNYSLIIFNNRDRDHHMPPMTRGQNTKYHDWELDHAITQNPTQLWKQSFFVKTRTNYKSSTIHLH